MTRNEFIAETAARLLGARAVMISEAVLEARGLANYLEGAGEAPWFGPAAAVEASTGARTYHMGQRFRLLPVGDECFACEALAKAAAESEGLGKGHPGTGSVACPKCGTGTIHYSVSGLNGHMHAACTTAGCVSWME